jgi:isocitrate dehydrogenase kinase/phosphatase
VELAHHAAELILSYLNKYRREFKQITREARRWFEDRDWQAARDGLNHRSALYERTIRDLVNALRVKLGSELRNRELWRVLRDDFATHIANRSDEELSETFFNSVTREVFKTTGIDRELEFVWLDNIVLPSGEESPVFKSWYPTTTLEQLFFDILDACGFSAPWEDMRRDARRVAARVAGHLQERSGMTGFDVVELVEPVLFRSKGAYLVGRIRRGHRMLPMVIPLVHRPGGIRVDAVILSETEVSTVFSFTRSYFLVDVERPVELVGFLRDLLPGKPLEELYISLGFTKHGKTVRYRGLYRFLEQSVERFEVTPGAKGMVMAVFHLPSYHLVFKVIRDKFAAPKTTTREQVHRTYQLVHAHDRVGRLVDAQEYERLRFPKSRFSEEVLKELLEACSETAREEDGEIIIEHLWVERKVYPLNLYVHEVDETLAFEAVIDHGQSIKDLAAVGLFPGDLLVKNFGVTRRGRVVFYDYDEIVPLSECRFRRMPDNANMDGESTVVADERDIFPEELRYFLWGTPKLRKVFEEHHSELFTVAWWRKMQKALARGDIPDVFPYPHVRRFDEDAPQSLTATGSSSLLDHAHQEPS